MVGASETSLDDVNLCTYLCGFITNAKFKDTPRGLLSHLTLSSSHKISMAPTSSHLRSLYRSILRELPSRPLSSPSPIQQRIRSSFADSSAPPQVEEAEQYLQYIRAQRMYATLLERYNPGMSMDEEERVRLSARRVGMDLPDEFTSGKKK